MAWIQVSSAHDGCMDEIHTGTQAGNGVIYIIIVVIEYNCITISFSKSCSPKLQTRESPSTTGQRQVLDVDSELVNRAKR